MDENNLAQQQTPANSIAPNEDSVIAATPVSESATMPDVPATESAVPSSVAAAEMVSQTTPEPPTEPDMVPAADAAVQPAASIEDPASEPAPADSPGATAPAADALPAHSTNANKKILLVEDDDNLADVYMMRFQSEGFDVHRVPNGEDALASALQYKPDIILLDVMMPKVSGFYVLDILRNTPETAKIKVVMLTALGQDTDKQRAQDLGVSDYLVKSQVVIADVVDRVKAQLS